MKRTLLYLSGATILALSFFSYSLIDISSSEEADRLAYEAYLREHKFKQSPHLNKKEIKSIPKKDRPNLGWEQDFLRTMNPRLKRPTPEKLPAIFKDVQRQKELFRGTPGAVSTPWVERGPNNIGGRTRAIMFDPNDDTYKKVWAGGVTGGLWFNNDITNSDSGWHSVDHFWDNIAITCIAYDPNNTQVFYVGTGEAWGGGATSGIGAGVWKTSDGGTSWEQLSATDKYFYVNDLVVRNESSSSVLYVGVNATSYMGRNHQNDQGGFNYGLYRSTNGGTDFSQVLPNINGGSGNYTTGDLKIGADNRIYVGTVGNVYGWGGGSVLYSDNGTSWSVVNVETDGGRVELGVAASNANYVYALCESGYEVSGIYKSVNGGQSWSSVSEPNDADGGIPSTDFSRTQAWYDLVIAVDPNDEDKVIAGGVDLFRSTDGGSSWDQISKWANTQELYTKPYSIVHADQHAIVFKPGSSSQLLVGNDGGVFYTNNISAAASSDVFYSRNKNYNVTQFYTCAIHPTAATDYFLAGAQDNGTQQFNSAGINSTVDVNGGDGAACFIDEDNPNYQIASYVYNVYTLSDNGGQSFDISLSNDQSTGEFINTADYDSRQNCLYSGSSTYEIQRISNVTSSSSVDWLELNEDMGGSASIIKVSPYTTSSTTLFIGADGGRIYKMTNANGSPSSSRIGANAGLPTGSVSSIEFGASEDEIIVTYSNYGVSSVWYTIDGGSSWSEKEGNLPDMPIRWALMNPSDSNEVIAATEVGVWSTSNFQALSPTWKASNSGLSNVRVDMLRMRDSDKEVIAATHGRGLFSSSAFGVAVAPTAAFSADKLTIYSGQSVVFSDESSGSPTSWKWEFEAGAASSTTATSSTVTYDSVGSFDVTLIAINAEGSDTLIKEDYITVEEAVVVVGCDTITNWKSTYTEITLGFSSGSGSWTGHNSFQFTQFAEYFTGTSYPTITGMELAVARADYTTDNSKITLKVWSDGALPTANNVIHEQDILIKNLNAGYFNIIEFDTAVSIGSNFYLGYEIYYDNPGDTIAIFQEYQADANSSFTEYGAWASYFDVGGFNSVLYMNAYVCEESTLVAANFGLSSDTICVGSNVSVLDSALGTALTYSWDFGSDASDSISSQSGSQVISYDVAGTKTIKLIVTDGSSIDSITKNIVVLALPVTSIISGVDTVCYGDEGDVYSVDQAANASFTWKVTGGAIVSGSGSNSVVIDWDEINPSGDIEVFQTNTNNCVGATVKLKVHKVDIEINSIDGELAICGNDTIQTYSIDGSVSYDYLWSITGGVLINDDSTQSIIADWDTSGSLTVYSSKFGCLSDTVALSVNRGVNPVEVNPLGIDTICSSLFGHVYKVDSHLVTNEYNWVLTAGELVSNAVDSAIVNWEAEGTSSIGVIAVDAVSKCQSDTTVIRIVKQGPTTSAIVGDTILCNGDTSTLSVTNTVGSSYSWSITGGSLISANEGNEMTVGVTNGTASLVVLETNSVGCVGDSVKKSIHGSTLITPTIVGNDSVCSGAVSQLFSVGSLESGVTSEWTNSVGLVTDETDTSIIVNMNGSNVITAYLKDQYACTSGIDTFNIAVLQLPTVLIRLAEDTIYLNNGSTTANITLEGYDNSYTYELDLGDGIVTSNVSASVIEYFYNEDGTYTLKLVASNGVCSDTSEATLVVLNSVEIDDLGASLFHLYPNPTKNHLNIAFKESSDLVTVEIRNVLGAQIIRKNYDNIGAGMVNRMDLSDYQPGIYFVKIKMNGYSYNGQVIIQ